MISLGKIIPLTIFIALACLGFLSAFNSEPLAIAQTQSIMSSNSTLTTDSIVASTPLSNTTTTSDLSEVAKTSLNIMTESLLSISNASTVTSAVSTSSTSAGATGNLTTSLGDWTTLTMVSTATTVTTLQPSTLTSDSVDYSIGFNPVYWPCTDVSVTFTGPLVESGLFGDTLQFQYFQYSPNYPSLLNPIFTDSGLTVTSDTVTYWISYNEYAQLNFAYQPNVAVKVVDMTTKPNGYTPGMIFMQLTNITPLSGQACLYDAPPIATPEFQADWVTIMASIIVGLLLLRRGKDGRE